MQAKVDQTQKDCFLKVQDLTDKFRDYKKKNNLDEYFEKYLSPETRKNTLKLVKDLLVAEEDHWTDYLKEYKE